MAKKEDIKEFVNNPYFAANPDDGLLKEAAKNAVNFLANGQGLQDFAKGLASGPLEMLGKLVGADFKPEGDSKVQDAGKAVTNFVGSFIEEPGQVTAGKAPGDGLLNAFNVFEPKGDKNTTDDKKGAPGENASVDTGAGSSDPSSSGGHRIMGL